MSYRWAGPRGPGTRCGVACMQRDARGPRVLPLPTLRTTFASPPNQPQPPTAQEKYIASYLEGLGVRPSAATAALVAKHAPLPPGKVSRHLASHGFNRNELCIEAPTPVLDVSIQKPLMSKKTIRRSAAALRLVRRTRGTREGGAAACRRPTPRRVPCHPPCPPPQAESWHAHRQGVCSRAFHRAGGGGSGGHSRGCRSRQAPSHPHPQQRPPGRQGRRPVRAVCHA
jgi:hypothetical protein